MTLILVVQINHMVVSLINIFLKDCLTRGDYFQKKKKIEKSEKEIC